MSSQFSGEYEAISPLTGVFRGEKIRRRSIDGSLGGWLGEATRHEKNKSKKSRHSSKKTTLRSHRRGA